MGKAEESRGGEGLSSLTRSWFRLGLCAKKKKQKQKKQKKEKALLPAQVLSFFDKLSSCVSKYSELEKL